MGILWENVRAVKDIKYLLGKRRHFGANNPKSVLKKSFIFMILSEPIAN